MARHELFAIIDAIYLLDQFLRDEIIKIWNPNSKAGLASRKARGDKFINLTDGVPLPPDFIRFLDRYLMHRRAHFHDDKLRK
jgi:hypothetical protein